MPKTKLYAILHDGTLNGDSAFFCPENHIKHNDTLYCGKILKPSKSFKELKKDFLNKMVKINRGKKEDIYELWGNAQGAWIVDKKTLDVLNKVWNVCDPMSLSMTYTCNALAKAIANKLAIFNIGKKAK